MGSFVNPFVCVTFATLGWAIYLTGLVMLGDAFRMPLMAQGLLQLFTTMSALYFSKTRETGDQELEQPIKTRLAELGGTVLAGSPADFGELIAAETEKWGKVVKFANIKPD